ncbi:WG repeat-containing protein [Actinoplanes utahensis]|uniref:WG repeat-containing protein n=1 Tax=Actinoplanes utahensis TaxID=1869 RepID=UPI001377A2A7|nr:WG repeat-containing protein [Actinoplanes utahensis]
MPGIPGGPGSGITGGTAPVSSPAGMDPHALPVSGARADGRQHPQARQDTDESTRAISVPGRGMQAPEPVVPGEHLAPEATQVFRIPHPIPMSPRTPDAAPVSGPAGSDQYAPTGTAPVSAPAGFDTNATTGTAPVSGPAGFEPHTAAGMVAAAGDAVGAPVGAGRESGPGISFPRDHGRIGEDVARGRHEAGDEQDPTRPLDPRRLAQAAPAHGRHEAGDEQDPTRPLDPRRLAQAAPAHGRHEAVSGPEDPTRPFGLRRTGTEAPGPSLENTQIIDARLLGTRAAAGQTTGTDEHVGSTGVGQPATGASEHMGGRHGETGAHAATGVAEPRHGDGQDSRAGHGQAAGPRREPDGPAETARAEPQVAGQSGATTGAYAVGQEVGAARGEPVAAETAAEEPAGHGLGWLLSMSGLGATTPVPEPETAAADEASTTDVANKPMSWFAFAPSEPKSTPTDPQDTLPEQADTAANPQDTLPEQADTGAEEQAGSEDTRTAPESTTLEHPVSEQDRTLGEDELAEDSESQAAAEQSSALLDGEHTDFEQASPLIEDEPVDLRRAPATAENQHANLEQPPILGEDEHADLEQPPILGEDEHADLEQASPRREDEPTGLGQTLATAEDEHTELGQAPAAAEDEHTQFMQVPDGAEDEHTDFAQAPATVEDERTDLMQVPAGAGDEDAGFERISASSERHIPFGQEPDSTDGPEQDRAEDGRIPSEHEPVQDESAGTAVEPDPASIGTEPTGFDAGDAVAEPVDTGFAHGQTSTIAETEDTDFDPVPAEGQHTDFDPIPAEGQHTGSGRDLPSVGGHAGFGTDSAEGGQEQDRAEDGRTASGLEPQWIESVNGQAELDAAATVTEHAGLDDGRDQAEADVVHEGISAGTGDAGAETDRGAGQAWGGTAAGEHGQGETEPDSEDAPLTFEREPGVSGEGDDIVGTAAVAEVDGNEIGTRSPDAEDVAAEVADLEPEPAKAQGRTAGSVREPEQVSAREPEQISAPETEQISEGFADETTVAGEGQGAGLEPPVVEPMASSHRVDEAAAGADGVPPGEGGGTSAVGVSPADEVGVHGEDWQDAAEPESSLDLDSELQADREAVLGEDQPTGPGYGIVLLEAESGEETATDDPAEKVVGEVVETVLADPAERVVDDPAGTVTDDPAEKVAAEVVETVPDDAIETVSDGAVAAVGDDAAAGTELAEPAEYAAEERADHGLVTTGAAEPDALAEGSGAASEALSEEETTPLSTETHDAVAGEPATASFGGAADEEVTSLLALGTPVEVTEAFPTMVLGAEADEEQTTRLVAVAVGPQDVTEAVPTTVLGDGDERTVLLAVGTADNATEALTAVTEDEVTTRLGVTGAADAPVTEEFTAVLAGAGKPDDRGEPGGGGPLAEATDAAAPGDVAAEERNGTGERDETGERDGGVGDGAPGVPLKGWEGEAAGGAAATPGDAASRIPARVEPVRQRQDQRVPADRRRADPEQILASYPWAFDPRTLREQVDDPDRLWDLVDRLSDRLEFAERDNVRAGLLSLRAVVNRVVGELDDALADGREALRHAEAAGELRTVAIAQARLAHVLQWRAEFAEADLLYARADSPELPSRTRAEIIELAGRSAFEQGRYLEAVNHFERALDVRGGADPELVERVELALDEISRRSGEGWGPYPRTRDELLGMPEAPVPLLDEGAGLWGYAAAVDPRYAEAQPFTEGLAWVRRPDAPAWELIDTAGELVIAAAHGYVAVSRFAEGLAWVSRGDGGWFAIDRQNRLAVPAGGFEDARPFRRGLAVIRQGGRWGAVDRNGRIAVQPEFQGFATVSHTGGPVEGFTDEGLAVVDAGDRFGVVDRTGRTVLDAVHAAVVIHPAAFLVRDAAGRWGALDRRGTPLTEMGHPSREAVADRLPEEARPVL